MFNDKSPYNIRIEKTDKGNRYFVSFIDGQNAFQELEVSYEVFLAVYQSVKDIRNLQRSDERHLEHSDLSEQTLNDRMFQYQQSPDELIHNSELEKAFELAVSKLPETQRRRFIQYYYRHLTYDQIAEVEGCTKMPIKRSIDRAKEKIHNQLKNFIQ